MDLCVHIKRPDLAEKVSDWFVNTSILTMKKRRLKRVMPSSKLRKKKKYHSKMIINAKQKGNLGDLPGLLNLDSLVDIVSNNVGILVILAVFMAMFSLLKKSEQTPQKEQPFDNIEKIKIPWSLVLKKQPFVFTEG